MTAKVPEGDPTNEATPNEGLHPNPPHDYLQAAFSENWQQVRHTDTQRFVVLNFYLAVTAGVVSLLATNDGLWKPESEGLFWLCLGLTLFSFIVYLVLLKLSYDLASQLRVVQWISERMQLIESLEGDDSYIAKQAMFRGFMGLPLPLRLSLGLPPWLSLRLSPRLRRRVPTIRVGVMEVLFVYLPIFIASVAFAVSVYNPSGGSPKLSCISGNWYWSAAFFVLIFIILRCVDNQADKQRESIMKKRRSPDLKVKHLDEIDDVR